MGCFANFPQFNQAWFLKIPSHGSYLHWLEKNSFLPLSDNNLMHLHREVLFTVDLGGWMTIFTQRWKLRCTIHDSSLHTSLTRISHSFVEISSFVCLTLLCCKWYGFHGGLWYDIPIVVLLIHAIVINESTLQGQPGLYIYIYISGLYFSQLIFFPFHFLLFGRK